MHKFSIWRDYNGI